MEKLERNLAMYRERLAGLTYAAISRKHGIDATTAARIVRRVQRRAAAYGVVACQSFPADPVHYERELKEHA